MKFLLLSHISPPATDGGSKVIYEISQELEKKHQVLLVSSNCQSTDDFVNPKSKSLKNGLPVYKFLYRPLKLLSLIFPSFLIFAKGPIFKLIPSIKTLIKIYKFKPEFIIAGPFPTTISIYARFLSKIIRPHPKLILIPCFHFTDPIFRKKILLNTLKNADYIWSLTNFETQSYINEFKIDSKYILTLGAGISPHFFKTPPNTPKTPRQNLLFIGSFAAHKGIEILIDAYISLIKKHPKLSLTLAGHPTLYSPIIERKINNLSPDIRKKVKIIYNPSSTALPLLIDHCSILILPSTQESYGLVLLEAMSRKKPVIATNIPALCEMIKKSNSGLTFKKNNVSDLTNCLTKLLRSPKDMSEYKESGYRYVVSNCKWDKIINKLCQNICP